MINRKVFLVAGHDIDGDPGAVYGSFRESEETVQITNKVAEILKQYPLEVIVDPYVNDMFDSVNFVNAQCSGIDDGIVIDIHKNSHTSTANGIETWIMRSPDIETVSLGSLIQECSIDSTGLINRGVKNENWYVITNAKCRGALIECGFINGDPNTDEYDTKYATGIANGILRFFDIPVVKPVTPVRLSAIDIPNKIVKTNKDTSLWDLTFTSFDNVKSVKVLPKGTIIEVSALVDHPLGGRYYLTEYSYKNGIFNGINVTDVVTHVAPLESILPPATTVLNEEVPIIEEPVVEQIVPEQVKQLSWLEKAIETLKKIMELLVSFRKK